MPLFSATFLRHRSTDRRSQWTMQLCRTHGVNREAHEIIVTEVEWQLPKLTLGTAVPTCQEQDRILWIDAIWSYQDNRKERGHQFSRWHYISWGWTSDYLLGLSTFDTDLTHEFYEALEEESIKHTCNNWKASDKRWLNIWSAVQTGLAECSVSTA